MLTARPRVGGRVWDTPYVVQPYLAEPLLHHGRKWDVRTYVLLTSVLPMRLYLFSEAIVRYASAPYSKSTNASARVRSAHACARAA